MMRSLTWQDPTPTCIPPPCHAGARPRQTSASHADARRVRASSRPRVYAEERELTTLSAGCCCARPQVMAVWDFEAAVERRDATGGTSRRSVLEQARKLEEWATASADRDEASKRQKRA